MIKLFEFVDYVWSFYGSDDALYPIKGLTKDQVMEASWLYIQCCCYPSHPEMEWGDGDSLDRERVRDILLNAPQFDGLVLEKTTWQSGTAPLPRGAFFMYIKRVEVKAILRDLIQNCQVWLTLTPRKGFWL